MAEAATEQPPVVEEEKLTWAQQQAAGPEDERFPQKEMRDYHVLKGGEYTTGIYHESGMTVELRDDVALPYIQNREIQEETRPKKLRVYKNHDFSEKKYNARMDALREAAGESFPLTVEDNEELLDD